MRTGRFHAWHLPQLRRLGEHPLLETDRGTVLAPDLGPAHVREVADALLAAGEALRALGNERVIAGIDRVARRLLDPADPLRTEALHWLPAVTGYGERMSQLVLDRMAADWTARPLRRLLRAELRDPRVLENFQRHARAQYVHALGPRLALHVLSGNVPGVGVTSLVRSLLVRAPALCKTAHAEPVLPVLFARALLEAEPALGRALAVAYWPGSDDALLAPALDRADLVIHYGGRESLAALRGLLPPHSRLVEHGPRLSFGMVAREYTGRRRTHRDAALAVAMFDQQGCVSPHVIYVEPGGREEPPAFAASVARELQHLARELPRGRLTPAEAAAILQLRASIEFRAIAGEAVTVWAGDALAYTVVHETEATFSAAPLNRTLWVKPVARLEDVAALLAPHFDLLQTAALAAPRERRIPLAMVLAHAGITRVTSFSAMPWPPPTWHHDGRGPLRELLRWTDLDRL